MPGPISQSYEGPSDDPPPAPPRWAFPHLTDGEYAEVRIPRWAREAASRLYERMEQIDGEALNQGQIEQDPEAERFTWTERVAEVIAAEFRAGAAAGGVTE